MNILICFNHPKTNPNFLLIICPTRPQRQHNNQIKLINCTRMQQHSTAQQQKLIYSFHIRIICIYNANRIVRERTNQQTNKHTRKIANPLETTHWKDRQFNKPTNTTFPIIKIDISKKKGKRNRRPHSRNL